MSPVPRSRHLFRVALQLAQSAFRAGQDISDVLSAAGFASDLITAVQASMSPAPRAQRGGRSQSKAASSDQAVAAGRGPTVPRFNLGSDTLLGLAQSQRRTLSALCNVGVSSVAGVYTEGTPVTLNNAFSPNGGAPAQGFAKYMAFYSKCFVVGARLVVHGAISTVGAANSSTVGLVVTTNATPLANLAQAIDNGMCQWTHRANYPDSYSFTESVDVRKFLNKPRVLDDPQLFCTAAAGPTQLVVAHPFIQGQNATTSVAGGYGQLLLDCIFTDPVPFT